MALLQPCAGDFDNVTPLYKAAWKGHVAVVEALLAKGADVNQGADAIITLESRYGMIFNRFGESSDVI